MRHFITGASSGIGAAIAAALYDRGDDLVILARTRERAEEMAVAFPGAAFLVGDLAQPQALESMLAFALLPLALDSLLHIAGIARLDPVRTISARDVREQVDVNLVSPMVLTSALLPALRRGRGHVVFANSSTGIDAKPSWPAYCASKFGLRAFADSLRAEEQHHGIRVTSLYLGRTATPMQQRVHEQEGWEYDPSRWIQPETVATSVLQLLDLPSDASIPGLWIRPAASGAPEASGGDPTWSAHEGRRTGISR
jgi:NAD(P)-dependent dehydrogenase (short-subunit alcohol dehydrogenase family)